MDIALTVKTNRLHTPCHSQLTIRPCKGHEPFSDKVFCFDHLEMTHFREDGNDTFQEGSLGLATGLGRRKLIPQLGRAWYS